MPIILGSGGAQSIPKPFCNCKNCSKARIKKIPYSRTGPSFYLEEGILFDTPEEIRLQIEKNKISKLNHVFYTHWHPDHTYGVRIFEHIKGSYPTVQKIENEVEDKIKVYIPENDLNTFKEQLSKLWYFEQKGFIEIILFKDRVPIKINNIIITPIDFQRIDRVRYGFLINKTNKKILYAPCSIFGMKIDEYFNDLDFLIMELGWIGNTKEIRDTFLDKNSFWQTHISFEENIELIERLKPKISILTHIGGHNVPRGDHDFLLNMIKKYPNLKINIAYDGMNI
ncbi:hypothetical protein COS64_03260 [archaeon CG06_land_8_20_14_3_00_37_11]|nr:MAG: hypothetical protein COS64_03260 [archaeon CG06_land_8_20_14_3_00_37_11]